MGANDRLRVAQLHEVVIERFGQFAQIIYKDDPLQPAMSLKLGRDIEKLSDQAILERFNEIVTGMRVSVSEYRPIEIADGNPQVKYNRSSKEWDALGQVLRCELNDDDIGEVSVFIDDHRLSLEEFAKMISSYRGWGMRIEFMDPSQLTNPPEPKIVKRAPRVKP